MKRLVLIGAAAVVCAHASAEELVEEDSMEMQMEMTMKEVDDALFLNEKFSTGYATMKPRGEMFFWHVPARKMIDNAPLVLWLTGGPGCGSELALFDINGPWWVNSDGHGLKKNEHSWTEAANMIYVDQPLGSGFSVADMNYKTSLEGVSKDLRLFMKTFLEKKPEFKNRPFFIAGESYGGHFIPHLTTYLQRNPIKGLDLKGIAIGNGWVTPSAQYRGTAEFAEEEGLVTKHAGLVKKAYETCAKLVDTPGWPLALAGCNALGRMVLRDKSPYDIRKKCTNPPSCIDTSAVTKFLNKEDVKNKLSISSKIREWKACSVIPHLALLGEFPNDAAPLVEEILASGLGVLTYYGDKDYVCNWKGGVKWVDEMARSGRKGWAHKQKWLTSKFIPFRDMGEIRRVENFAFIRVKNASHMVPKDHPREMLEVFREFVKGKVAQPIPKEEAMESYESDLKIINDVLEESVMRI